MHLFGCEIYKYYKTKIRISDLAKSQDAVENVFMVNYAYFTREIFNIFKILYLQGLYRKECNK